MNSKANVSLILGIVSVVFGAIECFFPFVVIGIITGTIAIIFGALSIKIKKERSIAGIVLGVTGILVALVWLHMMLIVK